MGPPPLSGVIPTGDDDGKIVEAVNPLIKLAIQFFVIPLAIVAFCVALVFIFRWLTWEKQDTESYLAALSSATRSSSQKEQAALKLLNYIQESKRWQGIYDMTEQLRFNREKFLVENPDFAVKVAQIFQNSPGAERSVRQYLVQVLGLVGHREVLPMLISALNDPDSMTVIHAMVALGRIGIPDAIPAILGVSKSEDRGLRQTAIFVLGNFHEPAAIARCAEALNDSDLLVSWNAAFALARYGDHRAVPILEQFLDAEYIERVTRDYRPTLGFGVTDDDKRDRLSTFYPERLEEYRVIAIRLYGQFADGKILEKLREVAQKDKQLKVRQAAIETLNQHLLGK